MSRNAEKKPRKRDWRISATLLAVWAIALVIIFRHDDQIPLSMLAIATVFFVLLVPAMNDVVRSIDKLVSGRADRNRESSNQAGR